MAKKYADEFRRDAVRLITTSRFVKWSGKTGQRAKMCPTLKTGYTNDEETQFLRQV